MTISVELRTKKMKRRPRSPYEVLPDHLELRERLRKTLYYGKLPETDRPSLPMTEAAVDVFQEVAPRGLGKLDIQWASSIGRRACVSPCSLMLGMLYLDRLKNKNPEYLQKVSSSELFLVSMMVASKYLYDEGVDEEVFNDEWAESAKMEVEDLNELECDFLTAIDWSLFVKPEDFTDSLLEMEKRIARLKGLEQGYYMYSDLMVLSQDARFLAVTKHLLQEFCKVIVVCSMAYMASALTIVGSTLALSCVRSTVLPVLQPAPSPLLPVGPGSSIMPVDEPQPGNISVVDLDAAEEQLEQAMQAVHLVPSAKAKDQTPSEETPHESPGRKLLGIQAPGLLTLTLLKDTVLHFVLGIQQQWHGKHDVDNMGDHSDGIYDHDHDNTGRSTHRCSCPNCPGKIKTKKKATKENMTEEFKANQSELNKDVTKNCVGKLPCRCTANAGPARHGTHLDPGSISADNRAGQPPKVCRLPGVTAYQMVAPLGSDLGLGFHTMTKTLA